MILISAGIFSPPMTSTMSPLTSFYAGIWVIFPSLNTLEADGNIFLNPSINAYDFAPCAYVMAPVNKTTIIKTKER